MSEKLVPLNEGVIKGQIKEFVRESDEETRNELHRVSVRRVEDITAAEVLFPRTGNCVAKL